MHKAIYFFITLVLHFFALVSLCYSNTEVDRKGVFNIIVENDKWSNTDRHYTNGLQLAYFLAPGKEGSWVHKAAQILPLLDSTGALRHGVFFGHELYTPDDITTSALLRDQRPYAAWLYGGLSISSSTKHHFDVWRMNLGVVGPSARGEEVQNNFHKLIGVEEAQGWDHQLNDKFGYMLIYERGWREKMFGDNEDFALGADVIPHAGFSFSNVEQYLNTGITFRFGNDLENDFGPPRIRPAIPGSEYFETQDFFSWYLFAGSGVRYVNRNIFIDGHDETSLYTLHRESWVADIQAGLVFTLSKTRFTYTYVYRTNEYKEQTQADRFASFGISILY